LEGAFPFLEEASQEEHQLLFQVQLTLLELINSLEPTKQLFPLLRLFLVLLMPLQQLF